jgi:phosphomannomutase
MTLSPEIFRSYDIRGVIPSELDAEGAEKIGAAFVVAIKAGVVVVGRDMRKSGDQLTPAVIKGITAQGADVVEVGKVTTPLLYFSVWQANAAGGVMVSASHNPAEYNGFKLTKAQAVPIGKESGLEEIKKLALSTPLPPASRQGKVISANYTAPYLAYATRGVERINKHLRIVIDFGNGAVGFLREPLLERLPTQTLTQCEEPDGSFPHHEANPLKEENVKDLQARVREEKADLGAAFDGDGDRVGFVDEQGEIVPGDLVTALLAQEILRDHPGTKIIYDVRCSRVVAEAIQAAGGVPVLGKVGHANIKAQMRQEQAVFAGELSSHFYFDDYYFESGIKALTLLLLLRSRANKPLSALVAPLRKYAKAPEMNFAIEDKAEAIKMLQARYRDGEQLTLDGLTVSYPDWWFNVRPSGTEPLLRLNIEANTAELLEKKKEELFALLGNPTA